ncbi:hypothetical protein [Nocardia veterana]|uniref:DUF5666 domain-containing protein n=1 Tax=Nocardia veterana TaxID=132249 RepID=A0A7X6RJW2_9NOCA|nr:hypothetical protein [Nocardia veterana]NKY88009.1 hypothetical protein [Nocardia veterana]
MAGSETPWSKVTEPRALSVGEARHDPAGEAGRDSASETSPSSTGETGHAAEAGYDPAAGPSVQAEPSGGPALARWAQTIVLIGFGVVAVLFVALLQNVSWSVGTPTVSTASTTATTSAAATAAAGAAERPAASGPFSLGGITVGAVVGNDGGVLRVRSPGGNIVTVHTDATTKVLVFPGSKVADIGPGSMVAVYGDERSDGSIECTLLMGLSL